MLPDFESAYIDRRKRRRLLFLLAGARLLRLMADTNTRKRVDYMAPRRLFDAVESPYLLQPWVKMSNSNFKKN